MHSSWLLISSAICVMIALNFCSAEQFVDEDLGLEKRAAMRNALVRLGRSAGMRNALVRFGKRSNGVNEYGLEEKRNGAPEPFVRFGKRSAQPETLHELLDLLQKMDTTNNA